MAKSVRGTLPTAAQRSDAQTLFYDSDKCNMDKVAAQVAMHRDAIADCQERDERMDRTMHGDPDTGFPGMRSMVTDMWQKETGKDATTKIINKTPNDVYKYIWMILGGLTLLGFLITAGMITFSQETYYEQ